MRSDELQSILDFALDAAKQAGDITLKYFRSAGLSIIGKTDGTPVTRADREAESHVRALIAKRYPGHAIMGEEHGSSDSASRFRWIIDPVDGTFSFIRGVPLYGTLIGLELDGDCILGVLHMPALNETVFAARGLGAWYTIAGATPEPAHVSSVATLDGALMCTTSIDYFRRAGLADLLPSLEARFTHNRGWSDCYASLLVATGRADAVIEPLIHPWDVAAIKPIIEEAGGRYSDWTGDPSIHRPTALITNGRIHDELVGLLAASAAHLH